MNLNQYEENENISDQLVLALQAKGETMQSSADFALVPSFAGKVDFVTDLLAQYDLFPKYIEDDKDNKKSEELRKKGNKLFGAKSDEKALEMYTYSVAVAENKSEDLGLAYANRSAVLFKLKLFEECLKDIESAFQNNYPDSLKSKLLERRKNAELLKIKQVKHPYHQIIPSIPDQDRNPLIESASDSIEIKTDPKLGRHIVATRDIEIGEIIAVEQAAFSLLTDRKWCHCHHCLTLCYGLVPCESCTQALFCSNVCKKNAKRYHDFECPILATVYTLDFNSCRVLPLRIAIIVKNEYKDLNNELDKEPDKIYRSGRYKEIHKLLTNVESRSASNLFERVTAAAIFYHLVKNYTDFFKNEDQECEDTFKSLVLHLLMVMSCNFHGIDDLEWDYKNVYELYTVGAGAYSFSSLFNHSCAPTVERLCYGTTIVLSTLESIKKGEQLFENYGYHYGMHTKGERQGALKKQYFFDCECRACKYEWGTYDTLPHIDSDVNILMLNYDKLANADLETARKIEPDVKNAVRSLEKKIPCQNFCEIQELLKQCHCVLGNIRRKLGSK